MSEDLPARIAARPALKVTPERIDSIIVDTKWFRLTATLMVCVIELENGFAVTGESACAAPENFDQKIGEELSFKAARDKVWAFEGYLLRQHLHENS